MSRVFGANCRASPGNAASRALVPFAANQFKIATKLS